ncbi:hypothetical protein ANN_26362 [Periplaneta americana]|uniref:Uncharacterized protein n=1 Tax=Periplaneta americana TaxID=6978 RepID=A0ABQ8RY03_PERAM|nr:hypothetical protein ANN_26362 [Periplaneta americana]
MVLFHRNSYQIMVQNFEATGSALKNKPTGRRRRIRTQETRQHRLRNVTQIHKRCIRQISSVVQISIASVRKDFKLLRYQIQIVQQLQVAIGQN